MLVERYINLRENLDEFLFEFLRPYTEAKLAPVYEEFKQSSYFKDLEREVDFGEIFEWVVSARPS